MLRPGPGAAYNGWMQALRQVAQFLAAIVWLVAGVPFVQNEFRRLSTAREAATRAEASAKLATTAAQSGDAELAVRAWTDAAEEAPDRADYRLELARATAQQVLQQETSITSTNVLRLQKLLEDAVAAGDTSDDILLSLGRIHTYRNQQNAARRRYDQVITANPKNARALMYLGDLQFKSDDLDSAVATLRRAVEIDPTLTLAKFALGQVYAAKKAWDDAQPWLETAAREAPNNAQILLAYGRVLVAKEQWPDALKALERAMALEPGLNAAYPLLGDAYVNTRRIEAALGAYRMAWEKARDLESLRKIGRIHLQLGALETAASVFSQIRDLAPDEPEPHMIIGLAANAAKHPEVARPAWERCVKLAEGQQRWSVVGDKCKEFLAEAPGPKGKKAKDTP